MNIVVEASADSRNFKGVTCHLAYFERGLDRPFCKKVLVPKTRRNSSISCVRQARSNRPISRAMTKGERVFSERRSRHFKTLKVKRIFDERETTRWPNSQRRAMCRTGPAKMSSRCAASTCRHK